jgi:lysophospholipase L1-like esterase
MQASPAGATGPVRRRRRQISWRAGLFVLAVSTLLTLLALELVIRIFWRAEIDPQLMRQRLANANIGPITQPSQTPALVYELRPGIDVTWQDVRVRTSDDGCCRVGDGGMEAPQGLRIAVLGDSTSFGWGVRHRDAYPTLLADRIRQQTGQAVTVRNFSVPGYGATQELAAWRRHAAAFKPHLLVLHYDHNDADGPGMLPADFIPPEYGDNVFRSALLKFVLRRLRALRNHHAYETTDASTGRTIKVFDGYQVEGPNYDDHIEAHRQLAQLTKNRGIPVVVVLFDADPQPVNDLAGDPHYQTLHARLISLWAGLGFHVLDLYPAYQNLMRQEGRQAVESFWLSPQDKHPNPRGHQWIARQVADFIHQQKLVGPP